MNQDWMIDESLERFYLLIERLRASTNGERTLASCTAKTGWPVRGVYFFFDPAECLNDGRPRVVRIGTHAITDGSSTTLWNRLSQHRGYRARDTGLLSGNHRGSVFRRHVGDAIIASDKQYAVIASAWGVGTNASRNVKKTEQPLELAVSSYIGDLRVLWLSVPDEPSPLSDRGAIERNVISLLSSLRGKEQFTPSFDWLGRFSPRSEIRTSGLWNIRHVGRVFDATGLDLLEKWVSRADGTE